VGTRRIVVSRPGTVAEGWEKNAISTLTTIRHEHAQAYVLRMLTIIS